MAKVRETSTGDGVSQTRHHRHHRRPKGEGSGGRPAIGTARLVERADADPETGDPPGVLAHHPSLSRLVREARIWQSSGADNPGTNRSVKNMEFVLFLSDDCLQLAVFQPVAGRARWEDGGERRRHATNHDGGMVGSLSMECAPDDASRVCEVDNDVEEGRESWGGRR